MFQKKYGNFFKQNIFEYVWFNIKVWFERRVNPFSFNARRGFMMDVCYFFSKENGFKSRKEVYETIERIGLIKIWYSFGSIHILARRPGLLIGKRGEQIDRLFQQFKNDWKFIFPLYRIKIHLYHEAEINLAPFGFEDSKNSEF